MSRTVRDSRLETRTARAALKPSGKPYYRAIDEGLHLGYRKGKAAGKWLMRRYAGNGAYVLEPIASADDTIDADGGTVLSFPQAQAVARQRFVERNRTDSSLPVRARPYTVRDAIDDYIGWMEQNRKSARDARWRADGLILPALGNLPCVKLTSEQVRSWLDGLAKQAPRLRTRKGEAQRFKSAGTDDPEEAIRRRRATANRTLTILKAALNHAWREHKVPSDDAWRPVKGYREADVARVRHLTIAESQRLINASDPDFRNLVQAALLTGARVGELGSLTVGDFNSDSGTLHIRISKSGKGRHVVLTEEGVMFFRGLAAGRSPRDRLLLKDDGGRWLKSHQTRPMNEACKRGKIDPPASFHVLRHTFATLTIMNGAPLIVVAKNLGHSDTRMVEKHYGHLAPSYVADAIRAAAPPFGIELKGNITTLAK